MTLFEQITTKTAEMASVSVEELDISRGHKKRWYSISIAWIDDPDVFGDIFYKALAHIAFGRYPRQCKDMKPLLALVEKAILTEADALNSWRNLQPFSDAFDKVLARLRTLRRRSCYSVYHFAICRFFMRTVYRDDFCKPLNLVTASFKEIKRAQSIACVKNEHDRFKEVIKMLIPKASKWTDAQWVSEKHIFSAFKTVHGVDYFNDILEFDCLITMLKNKLNDVPYYRDLFRIKNMNKAMAGAIWNKDINKEISKQLIFISSVRPHGEFGKHFCYPDSTDPAVITSSWAFKQLTKWRDERSYPLSDTVRSNMMLLGMGEHPFLVKELQKSRKSA